MHVPGADLLETLSSAKIYDLGQPYFVGMPHFPTHPPFLFGLTRQHGDHVGPAGHSSSAEALAMGGHCGTHIDALCHFSCGGKLFRGETIVQSYGAGQQKYPAETIAPILRRAVLLDIARVAGGAVLPPDFEVLPEHLDEASRELEVRAGDIVLLRTGWSTYWTDAARYALRGQGPGPCLAGAQWLSRRGIFAAGSDTLAFERIPSETMPVHVHLLVESGIHIIECLNLEELAGAGVTTFLFVAAPLKIRGATGAPMRPLALVA